MTRTNPTTQVSSESRPTFHFGRRRAGRSSRRLWAGFCARCARGRGESRISGWRRSEEDAPSERSSWALARSAYACLEIKDRWDRDAAFLHGCPGMGDKGFSASRFGNTILSRGGRGGREGVGSWMRLFFFAVPNNIQYLRIVCYPPFDKNSLVPSFFSNKQGCYFFIAYRIHQKPGPCQPFQ